MKKKLFLKSLALICVLGVFGGCEKNSLNDVDNLVVEESRIVVGNSVSMEDALLEAEAVGKLFSESNGITTRGTERTIGAINVITTATSSTRSSLDGVVDTIAYVVNFADDMGYVVVSADYRTESIFAAVPFGNLNLDEEDIDEPLALQVFYANAESIYHDQINSFSRPIAPVDQFDDGSSPVISRVFGAWEIVSRIYPLVYVTWGQRSPYNDNAPIIDGKRVPAGCTATALAQLMTFHRYPTNYNWVEMNRFKTPNSLIAKQDVARLFRTIGDNVDMEWDINGSGASLSKGVEHFKKMGYANPGNFSGYDFERIKKSISNGTPLAISAFSFQETYTYKRWFLGKKRTGYRYSSGHAWVLDGLLSRRRKVEVYRNGVFDYSYYQHEQLLHCNYGWSGGSDGYYNSAAFNTNVGPVTRTRIGEKYNFQFNLEVLYDVESR